MSADFNVLDTIIEVREHLAAGGSYVDENPMVISEARGNNSVERRVTDSPQSFYLFQQIAQTIPRVLEDESLHWLHNGAMATPIGMNLNLPLTEAIFMARTIQAMSTNPLPCHGCPNGDGRYTLARIDYVFTTFIASICEGCHAALGLEDGDEGD